MCLFREPVTLVSGLSVVTVNAKTKTELIVWISTNNRLCTIKLKGSIKVRRNRGGKQFLFIVPAYAPTGWSPGEMKDEFQHGPTDFLKKEHSTDIVELVDVSAQVRGLGTEESHLDD